MIETMRAEHFGSPSTKSANKVAQQARRPQLDYSQAQQSDDEKTIWPDNQYLPHPFPIWLPRFNGSTSPDNLTHLPTNFTRDRAQVQSIEQNAKKNEDKATPGKNDNNGLLILSQDRNTTSRSQVPKSIGQKTTSSRGGRSNSIRNNNQCIGNNHLASESVVQERRNLQLILVFVGVLCSHNASTCSAFSNSNDYYNTGLVRYNNHPHQTSDPYLTQTPSNPWQWSRPKRTNPESTISQFFNNDDDPITGIMSSAFSSFSQDQTPSPNSPPGVAQSWTSIFGGGGGGPVGTAGGGDALDVHIKNLLVPRVSGTLGNVQVRQYIIDALHKNDYHIETDEFTDNTPIGNVKFANIIASSNPNACRQLVLACHYDSKQMDGFLGATDSAVPCAMLLRISETFNKSFRQSASTSGGDSPDAASNLGLKFIFFDGEEAYVQWTSTDSLYGSRHLAAKWAKQPAPSQCRASGKKTELDRIELFVLLDLIGASDTSFVMYNTQLRHHYEALQKHEKAFLVKSGLNQLQVRRQSAFKGRTMPLDFVEDDHVPFKRRGVPILLLLSHPFPRVWHTTADNYQAIDFPKTRRILHVMEEFVSSYPNKSS